MVHNEEAEDKICKLDRERKVEFVLPSSSFLCPPKRKVVRASNTHQRAKKKNFESLSAISLAFIYFDRTGNLPPCVGRTVAHGAAASFSCSVLCKRLATTWHKRDIHNIYHKYYMLPYHFQHIIKALLENFQDNFPGLRLDINLNLTFKWNALVGIRP